MNVIMVAEDINKDGSFKQSKGELLCTVSTLAFIKHFFPHFHTIFFVDKYTKKYYESFGITELFDEVNDVLLDQEIDIDKQVFWSAGKLMAQRVTKAPLLMLDLDFWLFSDISKLGVFDSDISCLWVEETDEKFYFSPEFVMKQSELNWGFDWDKYAINVSLLYLKDNTFKDIYTNLAINFMKTMFGKVHKNPSHDENTKYILFAEQYMLNQLAKKYNKNVSVIIDDLYDVTHLLHVQSLGIDMENSPQYIYHMGHHKKDFREQNDFAQIRIDNFYDITKNHIKDDNFLKVFEKIYNSE